MSCSLMFTTLNSKMTNVPPMSPDNPGDVDTTFGFLTSYMVLPLLIIAEDRKDYSVADSNTPANSTMSYRLFTAYSGVARFIIGLILCFSISQALGNEITLDPFQVMLVVTFTITSVCSKMTAYLYKFTQNHMISLFLPCVISLGQALFSHSETAQVNTVANYVALFFAYQFLIIIPFGLFYLRSCQLTLPDPNAGYNDNEESMIANAGDETLADATALLESS